MHPPCRIDRTIKTYIGGCFNAWAKSRSNATLVPMTSCFVPGLSSMPVHRLVAMQRVPLPAPPDAASSWCLSGACATQHNRHPGSRLALTHLIQITDLTQLTHIIELQNLQVYNTPYPFHSLHSYYPLDTLHNFANAAYNLHTVHSWQFNTNNLHNLQLTHLTH